MEELRQGELEVGGILNKRRGYVAAVEYSNELGTTLAMLSDHCEHLRLRSAVKQVSHIKRRRMLRCVHARLPEPGNGYDTNDCVAVYILSV